MIPKLASRNKNVAIATKLFVFLVLFIFSLICSTAFLIIVPSSYGGRYGKATASNPPIPALEKYYVRYNPTEYGLSLDGDNLSAVFYPTLDALFDDLLSQHQDNVVVEFVGDVVLTREVRISNLNNRLSDNAINLTIVGKVQSTVEGSTFYADGREDTYALHITNIDKVTLSNFTLETNTMAINVSGNSHLIIDSSTITTQYNFLNKRSTGTIFNGYLSKVDIKGSAIRGINDSTYEFYAVYNYGDISIDKDVSSGPFSIIECFGGISMESGTLAIHGGEIRKTVKNPSFYALKIVNSAVIVAGGYISDTSELSVSSILVKQADLQLENGVKVDNGVFVGANDVNESSSVTVGSTKIMVPAGEFDIVMSCRDTIEFGVNDNDVSLTITNVNEDRVDSPDWGESSGNVIKLSEIEQLASEGVVRPRGTIYHYIVYKYLDAMGSVVTDSQLKIEEGKQHVIKKFVQLYKPKIFVQEYWEDNYGGKHLQEESIVVEKDYELIAKMQIKQPIVELGYRVLEPNHNTIELIVSLPEEYKSDNINIMYKWYEVISAEGLKNHILDTETPLIAHVVERANSRYQVVVEIKVLDLTVFGEGKYYAEFPAYVDVSLESTNIIPEDPNTSIKSESPDVEDSKNNSRLALILGTTIPSVIIVVFGSVLIILHRKGVLAKILAKKASKKGKGRPEKKARKE
ncbi:MAG: hypothetical protein GX959_04995 [Clostridiales bacterium]|nr:hypothetical protein [Clostridiales bacterium]